MKKIKVLFLVNHDVVIYNFRKELVSKLLDEGYEVIISCPYGERIDKLVDIGCKFIATKIDRHGTNIIKDFMLLRFYKKLIKDVQPNVILTFTIKPNIYGGLAAKSLKVPYIANITGLGTAVEKKGLLQKLTIFLYKFSFRSIHKVFFQNTENMNFFYDNKIALNKHILLPGSGVNLEHFHVLEYPSKETVEFVFISRIMKEKGIENYLDAAKYIKSKYSYVNFHICGFCEENYLEILNSYEKQGIIQYHGMINDVREILKITHCTIHPSYYPEGLSNVLLESSACGRPIITTNRSGCKEVVDNGVNGFLIEQNNSMDLINKIELFLGLEYSKIKQMGQFGRKKAEQFDRNVVVEAYLKEIKNGL